MIGFREFLNEAQYLSYKTTNLLQSYATEEEIDAWNDKHSGTSLIKDMEKAVKADDEDEIMELLNEVKGVSTGKGMAGAALAGGFVPGGWAMVALGAAGYALWKKMGKSSAISQAEKYLGKGKQAEKAYQDYSDSVGKEEKAKALKNISKLLTTIEKAKSKAKK